MAIGRYFTHMLPFVQLVALSFPALSLASSVEINTTSGNVRGVVDSDFPNVAQYRNIPFAESPVGNLRFASPVKKVAESQTIDATNYGPACLQYISDSTPATVLTYVPGLTLEDINGTSEDCLSLAVWTPTNATASSKLPVMIWIYGGAFTTGGLNTPFYVGANYVQRTQEHIIVAMNYRVNIMGTPNAAGLAATGKNLNFGLQDQRLA